MLFISFISAKEKKCTSSCSGETVTGEDLSVQSGCAEEHRAGNSAAGTE